MSDCCPLGYLLYDTSVFLFSLGSFFKATHVPLHWLNVGHRNNFRGQNISVAPKIAVDFKTCIHLIFTGMLLAHLSRRLIGELIGYSCSVVRPSSDPQFQTSSPKPPKPPIKVKFYVEPPWVGGTKVCSLDPGHMTKMAAMPIYIPFKNLLLRNRRADFHETWHVASGTSVHHSLLKC